MILLWSKHQTGPAAQVIRYLLETEVTKTAQQQASVTRRSPAPELLLGDPILVGMMIDSLPFQCRYRCATLSWAEDELDVARFNDGAVGLRRAIDGTVRLFLELACAGIPERARPPVLVGTHTHLGRLEVNILMPRAVGLPGAPLRSWNPHPPTIGSRADWDAYVDVVNSHYGWFDPRDPKRRRATTPPSWMAKEAAEIMRRSAKGEKLRLGPSDPRFRAWALLRQAVQQNASNREAIRQALHHGLAPYQWGVTSESRTSLTCGALHRAGPRVTFKGAALGDGDEDAIDPYEAQSARWREIARAPQRLRDSFKRRAENNYKLCSVPRDPVPPKPLNIIAAPRPLAGLNAQLATIVSAFAQRLRSLLSAALLQRALHTFDLRGLSRTAQILETLDAQPHRNPAPAPHRSAGSSARTRSIPTNDGQARPAGRAPKPDRHHPEPRGLSHARYGASPTPPHSRRRTNVAPPPNARMSRPDARQTASDAVPDQRPRKPPRDAPHWTRADWLIHVRNLTREVTGAPLPVALAKTREGEAIAVQRARETIVLPINSKPPHETWDDEAREAITRGLEHGDPAPTPGPQ
ncbi:hypothetical protein ACGYKD_16690 [Sulfitobacter sp. TB366]|uniref:hypothetical protein n=1 Tax=Sulfitobacter sp. TB366 TaxID=3368580 RepID=UPI003744E0AD